MARYLELHNDEIKSSGNPLCFALSKGHFEMAKRLVSRDIVNQLNKARNRTPLLIAIEKCHTPMVQYLFENGATIEASCLTNITPIHLASKIGYLPMVEYLVSKGANVNEKIGRDITPLHLASDVSVQRFLQDAQKFKHDIVAAIKNDALGYVQYLVEYGVVGVNDATDNKGVTPLMHACHNGNPDIVEYLVENGAVVSASTETEVTPLHYAAAGGNIDVVKYVVGKYPAGVGATTTVGNKPLHNAALNGHLPVVKYLVEECHVDASEKGKDDKTPLEMAKANTSKNRAVVEYLETIDK